MAFNTKQYRYKVEAYIIDYQTSEYKDFGGQISSIAIRKKYSDQVYPLYNVTMRMSLEQSKYIATNKYYLSLKIYRCPINSNTLSGEDVDSASLITDKLVTDIILRPFDSPKTYEQLRATESDEEKQTAESQYVNVSVNFVPKEQLKINNTIINNCYSDVNIVECVLNTISENYNNNALIQHIKNNKRYESVLIPPNSLVKAIKFLQQNYGIYEYGINMFFEFNKLYVYDIKETDREYQNNFYIEIESNVDNKDMTKYSNNYYDEENNVRKYIAGDTLLVSSKDIIDFSIGDSVTYSSYDDNFNIVNRKYDINTSNIGGDVKVRQYWNNDREKSFEARLSKKISEMSALSLDAFDFSIINPFTKFVISGSNNININGQYCLLSEEIFLGTNDYKSFNCTTSISLGKY